MFALGVSCRYLPVRRVQVLECVCSAQTKLFQTYILYITCNMSHKGLNVRLAMTQHQVTLSDKTAALFNDWDKNTQNQKKTKEFELLLYILLTQRSKGNWTLHLNTNEAWCSLWPVLTGCPDPPKRINFRKSFKQPLPPQYIAVPCLSAETAAYMGSPPPTR